MHASFPAHSKMDKYLSRGPRRGLHQDPLHPMLSAGRSGPLPRDCLRCREQKNTVWRTEERNTQRSTARNRTQRETQRRETIRPRAKRTVSDKQTKQNLFCLLSWIFSFHSRIFCLRSSAPQQPLRHSGKDTDGSSGPAAAVAPFLRTHRRRSSGFQQRSRLSDKHTDEAVVFAPLTTIALERAHMTLTQV